ncbi:GNAT family N-acetyltransferase [Streptomyces sp. A0592]|uniref:GNAT family N-acetyltransferase n=1 Tax=Streptomyces sp. A0592 TaxID=2563099 RepID=UPI00109EC71A|nr:GNAT family N-acetyltransferase [Streptomyces sp. A0592]THA86699.1 N-acetyltransferase [Streptomyces sp. A0592]
MNAHTTAAVVHSPGALLRYPDALTALLTDYHLSTEAEKGLPVADASRLPARYLAEIRDPRTAFADATVFLAVDDGAPAGCLVVTAPDAGTAEIKRVWTDPARRGRGVASVLLRAAVAHCAADSGVATVRLSVWSWRTPAIALYERLGFRATESWDPREDLVCMEYPSAAGTPRAGCTTL